MTLAIRTRRDGHKHLHVGRVFLNFLFSWLAPSLLAAGMSQILLPFLPNGPIKETPLSVILFMLMYGFMFSWAPLLVAVTVGLAFLRFGIAGWLVVISLATFTGAVMDGLITDATLMPFSLIVGAIYGMFLWLGLWLFNRASLTE